MDDETRDVYQALLATIREEYSTVECWENQIHEAAKGIASFDHIVRKLTEMEQQNI